jgi:NDP-sugar pyrophosphorylase family protein
MVPGEQTTRRAVIMAGGEGRRLRPFTYTIPKPLLPVGKRPIAEIIVTRLRDCGIADLIMTLGSGGDLIRAYFRDGSQFGVRISYFQETAPLGTGGCLKRIPELREAPFLVTNGDILTDVDFSELLDAHTASQAVLTVGTRWDESTIPYGVLDVENGHVRSVEEKPTRRYCFNAGVYGVSPAAIDFIPEDGVFDMTDLINQAVAADSEVRAFELSGLWFDLARVDDFEKAIARLEQTHPHLLM